MDDVLIFSKYGSVLNLLTSILVGQIQNGNKNSSKLKHLVRVVLAQVYKTNNNFGLYLGYKVYIVNNKNFPRNYEGISKESQIKFKNLNFYAINMINY